MIRHLSLLYLFLLFYAACPAQTDREFWFAAPHVDDDGAKYNIPIVLRMTSFSSPATVTISLPANPTFRPIVIVLNANSTQSVDLSPWLTLLQSAPPDLAQNKGMLIQSTADITAYYEVVSSYCNCNPEVFSLKGRNALGTEFYISSQYTYSIDTVRQPVASTSFDIIASANQTTVTITPTQPIVGHQANIPYSIFLNRGQTYSATGIYRDLNHHLQGSHVVADRPIAITLKDDLVWGDGTCADLIGDQTIPVNITGNEYVVSKGYLVPRDRVFVLAVSDNTPIFLDGNTSASVNLGKGQSWTFNLSNKSTYIRSDKNFYVYHVTGNGCELGSAIIPKINCTGSSAVSVVRSSNEQFGVMLITKSGSEGSFMVNGDPAVIQPASFSPVPGTGGVYTAATIDLSSFVPAGSVLNFSNSTGKFSMGFIDGSAKEGCRYGFFSDYKSSNVATGQIEICPNGVAQLNAFGGISYQWSPAAGLSDPHIANPVATPDSTTLYKTLITDADGCQDSAFVNVSIRPPPLFYRPPDTSTCAGYGVVLGSANPPNYIYTWLPAIALDNPSSPYPTAQPSSDTRYTVNIRDSVCTQYDSSFSVKVGVKPVPTVTAGKDNDIDCSIHSVQLQADGALAYAWTPANGLNDPGLPDPVATVDSTTAFTVKGTAANGCFATSQVLVKVTATGTNLFLVPSAFTPNGDGHNDCFGITHWGDVHIEELSVYSRLGLRVFTTRNPSECWDGNYRGQPQQTGAYAYVIRAHTICGSVTRTGTIMLIR